MNQAIARQEGGNHYKNKGIQPIEYIMFNRLGFCEGNVVKYVTRYKEKNGLEDLRKARHYLDFLIEDLERKANASSRVLSEDAIRDLFEGSDLEQLDHMRGKR